MLPAPDLVDLERTTQAKGKTGEWLSRWPVRAAYLRALSDLGLSDAKIAAYLRTSTEQVAFRRSLNQIAEGEWRN